MIFSSLRTFTIGISVIILSAITFSCNKNPDLHAFDGYVYNLNKEPVIDAQVQIFKSPQDWLTGHHIVTTMTTDRYGHFYSSPNYEEGDYFIFIEKYDTSNWDIRNVENGIYPKITLPTNGSITQTVESNNMSLLANTRWTLSNTLIEYTEQGHTAIEWHSTWHAENNCIKDNQLIFGKDLSMRVYEGNTVCKNQARNVIGKFVPPIIFTSLSCDKLMHTTQNVKQFVFPGWPEMEQKKAEIFLDCDQSLGQIYLIFNSSSEKKTLHVYNRY